MGVVSKAMTPDDGAHGDHVLGAERAADLLGELLHAHRARPVQELLRDLDGGLVVEDHALGGERVPVQVPGLLVEADQQVDALAVAVDALVAHAYLVHARPALDLGRVGAERLRPVPAPRGRLREDVPGRDDPLAGLAGKPDHHALSYPHAVLPDLDRVPAVRPQIAPGAPWRPLTSSGLAGPLVVTRVTARPADGRRMLPGERRTGQHSRGDVRLASPRAPRRPAPARPRGPGLVPAPRRDARPLAGAARGVGAAPRAPPARARRRDHGELRAASSRAASMTSSTATESRGVHRRRGAVAQAAHDAGVEGGVVARLGRHGPRARPVPQPPPRLLGRAAPPRPPGPHPRGQRRLLAVEAVRLVGRRRGPRPGTGARRRRRACSPTGGCARRRGG